MKYLYSIILLMVVTSCGDPVEPEPKIDKSLTYLEDAKKSLEAGNLTSAKAELNRALDFKPENNLKDSIYRLLAIVDAQLIEDSIAKSEFVVASKKKFSKLLIADTDEFTNRTFYHHKNIPNTNLKKGIELYIIKTNSDAYLRCKINYLSDSWLFVRSYQINVDGMIVGEMKPDYNEISRDNSAWQNWEWYDYRVDNIKAMSVVEYIALSKKAVIRYSGDDYYSDHVVTTKEKKAISDMIEAYNLFKKNPDFSI